MTVLIIILKLRGKLLHFKFNWRWQNTWLILKQSLPFSLSAILMSLYTKTDVVMLERFLPDGAQQAGIYASAYRLLDAVNILGFLFANLALPMFSRMRREKTDMLPLLKLGVQAILFLSVTFTSAVVVHRHFIMHALYREANNHSDNVLGLLMISFIAFCLSYVISTYLNANKLTQRANRVYGAALLVSITCNIIAIPLYKSEGTAVVTLLTQYFVLVALWVLAWQHLKPPPQSVWFLKLIGFCLSAGFIQWFILEMVPVHPISQMFLGSIISFFMGLILDIIPRRDMLWQFKKLLGV